MVAVERSLHPLQGTLVPPATRLSSGAVNNGKHDKVVAVERSLHPLQGTLVPPATRLSYGAVNNGKHDKVVAVERSLHPLQGTLAPPATRLSSGAVNNGEQEIQSALIAMGIRLYRGRSRRPQFRPPGGKTAASCTFMNFCIFTSIILTLID